jgi:hypothetical protein
MTDFYQVSRADIVHDVITAEDARKLIEDVLARPEIGLRGDLESGFHFWTAGPDGLLLVQHHVTPCP